MNYRLMRYVQADIIYITSLTGPASSLLFPIVRYAKENQKKVATNPGTPQIRENPEITQSFACFDRHSHHECNGSALLPSLTHGRRSTKI